MYTETLNKIKIKINKGQNKGTCDGYKFYKKDGDIFIENCLHKYQLFGNFLTELKK